MPNLRIVSDNALERATSLVASSTAGALAAANLANWKKSSLWRATGTSARITALFAAPEPIQFFGFPFCNWSPTTMARWRVSTEGAATNMLRYSEQFDDGSWTKVGGNLAANAMVAPDGQTTADRFTSSSGDGYLVQYVAGGVAGQTYTLSGWLKSTANRSVNMYIIAGATGQSTKAVTTAWQRFTFTFTATASGNVTCQFGGGSSLPAGAELHVWGAQLELGAAASSYYPSGAAPGVRPPGYIDSWQSYDYDSGLVPACPWPAAKLRGYTAAQAASAYAYGGGTYARHWLPAEIQARGIAVDIVDPDNAQGYLEAACMVVGPYWSPKYNASAISVTPLDGSDNVTTGGGDTCGEVGFISSEVSIELTYMEELDRAAVMRMTRNSSVYPLLVSGLPNDADPARERAHMAYATRSKNSAIALKYAAAYTTTITFKEV